MNDKIKKLEELILQASKAYYDGKPFISDSDFDSYVEDLQKVHPNSIILKQLEHHNDWNYNLEELPTPLYSMKKIKDIKDIQNWIKFCKSKLNTTEDLDIVLSLKYDGIKILNNENGFYTRYEDGLRGYNVTNRALRCNLKNNPIDTEGELIISKSNFEKIKLNSEYKSSRNFIPAIFSSKNLIEGADKVKYIRYSLYNDSVTDKFNQLTICNAINSLDGIKIPFISVKASELTEALIEDFYFSNIGEFECDGVILDIDRADYREMLGETQKYRNCARAYKNPKLFDNKKETILEDIYYQMSRYGKLTPVGRVKPTLIDEGVVSRVSLYNAKYIKDNFVQLGQKVTISRRGKINPKVEKFHKEDNLIRFENPTICPFCGEPLKWNETKVDLLCLNEKCKEKITQKFHYFFKMIGVEEFGLETIREIIYNANFRNIDDFLNEDKVNSLNLEGIGEKTKDSFNKQIKDLKKGISLEHLQEGSGFFEGMSSKTLQKLNQIDIDLQYLMKDSYYNFKMKELQSVEGIGYITANGYLSGVQDFYPFYSEVIKHFVVNKIKSVESDISVVFSGFRDKDLQSLCESKGIEVKSSISKKCKYLILKDTSSTSSKVKKAKELNIEILSLEEFKEKLN